VKLKIWKELVVAYFKVLSWHLPVGAGEHHEDLSQETRYAGRCLQGLPPYYIHNARVFLGWLQVPFRSRRYAGW